MRIIFSNYKLTIAFLYFIGFLWSQNSNIIKGVIYNNKNKEPVQGASILIDGTDIGTSSNQLGLFNLKFKVAYKKITVSMIGFKDTTVIINNQKIDKSIKVFLTPEAIRMTEVTVHSHKDNNKNEAPSSISMMGNRLKKNINSDLATTLTGESGFAMRSSGQATQRPILRGYSGDRFLITSDGFELGDLSNTTADHAVSMEISSAEGIEVMRGPETLAYGSNTIAGIINILSPMNGHKKIERALYNVFFGHESSNESKLLGANINIPLNTYQLFTSLTNRKSSDQSSPLGSLKNTALIKNDFTLAVTKFGTKNLTTLQIKDFSMDYGIPGSPEGHINGVDLDLKNQSQKLIYHRDIKLMSFNILDIEQGYIRYGHKEFVKDANYASIDLRQNIIYLNALLSGEALKVGINYQDRDYLTRGFIWTPNSNETKLAIFGINNRKYKNLKLQFSGRIEYRSIKPSVKDTFFSNIEPNDVKKRDFTLVSFGISTLNKSKNYSIYNHILYTSRAPKIEDLYSDGPHLGSYSYEIGEPKLDQENTLGFENTFSFFDDKNEFNLTSYINYSSNFHMFQKMGDGYEPGADWIEWGSGSSGWLYKYKIFGLETLIYGFEPNFKINLKYFNLLSNASICRGLDLQNNIPLAYIPPDLIRFQMEKNILFLNNTFEFLLVSKQDKLGEFETSTDGYKLFNYNCSYTFSKNNNIHQLIFQVSNILNETYYNHLSKIKMIMPEPGLGFNINYRVRL